MVISIFRHLQRTRSYLSGVRINKCIKKFYSANTVLENQSLQNDTIVDTELVEIDEVKKDPFDYDDYFNVKSLVNLKELFDARVHLGHHEGCFNPLNRPFIYGLRASQHIIDLNQTVECLQCALNVLSHIVYKNGIVCFVSTNPRYDYLIQKTARSCGVYFITREWQKGSFTNINRVLKINRVPDLIIGFQLSRFEKSRDIVLEAAMCNIPVIGIIDTDCDPCMITYPVPANDDTMDSVEKLCSIFKQAVLNAKDRIETDKLDKGDER